MIPLSPWVRFVLIVVSVYLAGIAIIYLLLPYN
jgi:hypothetical protein